MNELPGPRAQGSRPRRSSTRLSNAERAELGERLRNPRPAAPHSGRELPPSLRAKFEDAYGASFRKVRVHEGPEADQVNALAYTRGDHIHFRPGGYDPYSARGREMLGHELAHVVQQRRGRVALSAKPGEAPINVDPVLEREADAHGQRAARGERVGDGGPVPVSVPAPAAGGIAPIQRIPGGGLARDAWEKIKRNPKSAAAGAVVLGVGGLLLSGGAFGVAGAVMGAVGGASVGQAVHDRREAHEQEQAEQQRLMAEAQARLQAERRERQARRAAVQGWDQSDKPSEQNLAAHRNVAAGDAVPIRGDMAVLGTDYADQPRRPRSNLLSPLVQRHTTAAGMPLHMAAHLYNTGQQWSNVANRAMIDQIIDERRHVALGHHRIEEALNHMNRAPARLTRDAAARHRFFSRHDNVRKKLRGQGSMGTAHEVAKLLKAGYTWDGEMLHPPPQA